MAYKVGDLELDILGTSTKAEKSIDIVTDSLKGLLKVVNGISVAKTSGLQQIGVALNNISTAASKLKTTNLDNFAKSISSMSSILTSNIGSLPAANIEKVSALGSAFRGISQLAKYNKTDFDALTNGLLSIINSLNGVSSEKLEKLTLLGNAFKGVGRVTTLEKKLGTLNFDNIATGFAKLADAVTPFLDKVKASETSLNSLYGILQKVGRRGFGASTTQYARRGTGLFGINWRTIFNIAAAMRFGRAIQSVVQYATDFTETLNLWQVAMRDTVDTASEFVDKMHEAYSISKQTLMNAQATFRNMFANLGDLSSEASYKLSEGVVQMALDFSSLYNTTFEQAIYKFEAALAGQVRPIRAGSGYDITENTLYQVYKELGGTKTQRQLSITEKRLLGIYSVFQQMQRSGAVGDLSKTLDNFANQARMVTENFAELKTNVGLFVQDLLQSANVLQYVNAALIFASKVVQAMTKYETPNFIEGMFESTTAENEALDELQGKLLDFDKFRALESTSNESDLGIDRTIIDAMSSYESILDNVNNSAKQLATTWMTATGLFEDTDGELTPNIEKLERLKDIFVALAVAVGALVTTNILGGLAKLFTMTKTALGVSTVSIAAFTALGYTLTRFIQSLKDGDVAASILWGTISTGLVVAMIALNKTLIVSKWQEFITLLGKLRTSLIALNARVKDFTNGISALNIALSVTVAIASFKIFDGFLGDLPEGIRQIASLTTALIGLAVAIAAVRAIASGGKSLPTLLAAASGVGAIAAGIKNLIPQYALGASNIDSGTLFIAGEAGKTEAVYTGSNGKTNVANIQQMKAAFYQALVEYGNRGGNNTPIVVTLDGKVIYESTTAIAKRRGNLWGK